MKMVPLLSQLFTYLLNKYMYSFILIIIDYPAKKKSVLWEEVLPINVTTAVFTFHGGKHVAATF